MNNPTVSLATPRIQSVDILRGAIMIIMAIDHVRVYAGIPAGSPDPAIFFTRWITHFCAPGFVFLAGTSAFLYSKKLNNQREIIKFLITRGLFLILLEFTLIKFFWTFDLDYRTFTLAGVIWMIGICMVLLSALISFQPLTISIIGLIIIFGQYAFGRVPQLLPITIQSSFGKFWEFVYPSGFDSIEGITILYVIVPWIGVMACGFAFGYLLLMEKSIRDKLCKWIGLNSIIIFLLIGSYITMSTTTEGQLPFILKLLNQQKYPASPLYLMMSLGPIIALVPFAESIKGKVGRILETFGRVPMFYYLLHIPIIHISALMLNTVIRNGMHNEWYATAPYTQLAPEARWPLAWLYLIFIIDVIILYVLCNWYSKYKQSHSDIKLLKYL